MKKYFYTPVLVVLLTSLMTVRAQDRKEYLGLPGDNLNLFAVMDLFQDSETLEGFEKNLNDQNNHINNLDLNSDGYVDYIRVIDNVDRNVHFIVLQVAVSPREIQDVAVFTVMQLKNGEVQIQLVGDEALYGRDYIIEPIYDETPNPGYTGRRVNGGRVNVVHTTYYEIAAWPVIRFIYMPTYTVWHSPWHWDHYPVYWSSWNPYYWHYYHGYHSNYYSYYYGHYRHWHHHRYDNWHDSYYSHYRSHSPYVHTRISEGHYKNTYSRPELRKQGTDLYYRTRQADNRSGVASSGGRRTSSGSAPVYTGSRQTAGSGTRTSAGTNTRNSNSSGTRTSAGSNTRESSGSATRTSTNTNTRQSSGARTTTNGNTRQSSGTSTSTNGNTRQSGTGASTKSSTRESSGTRTSTNNNTRESSGTRATSNSPTRESSGNRESTSKNGNTRSSGSSQSTSRSSSQRSEGSSSDSGRRSGSSSSGSQEKSSSKTSGSERNSGRR